MIDLVNSVIIFLSQTTLLKIVNFPTQIRLWLSQSRSIGFFSSDASICSAIAFPLLENSDHVCVLVFIDFPSNSQRDAAFHRIADDYSRADQDSLRDIWEMFDGRISLNPVLLLLLVNFLSGFRLELIYISLIVSTRLSFTHLHVFQLLVLLP